MARTQVYIGMRNLQSELGFFSTHIAKMNRIRDRFYTKLVSSTTPAGKDWKVGELFSEVGTSSNYVNYGFEIRSCIGGIESGHSWVIMLPRIEIYTSPYIGAFFGNNDDAILNKYLKISSTSTSSNNNISFYTLYNNNHSLTADYVGTVNGTLSVGDVLTHHSDTSLTGEITAISGGNLTIKQLTGRKFKVGDRLDKDASNYFDNITSETNANFFDFGYDDNNAMTFATSMTKTGSNIFSETERFMPSVTSPNVRMPGVLFETYAYEGVSLEAIVGNGVNPFLGIFLMKHYSGKIEQIGFMGNIISPYSSSDTYISGTFVERITGAYYKTSYSMVFTRHFSYGTGGPLGGFSLSRNEFFTNQNEKDSSGKYRRIDIIVQNANEVKGILNNSMFATIGSITRGFLFLYEGPDGPYKRFEKTTCYPYSDEVGLPQIRYDIDEDA